MSAHSDATLAVVAVAYNRPASLQRLLTSLANAHYPSNKAVPLIISVDYSGDTACTVLAQAFHWEHGPKTVIAHPRNLGLREHILSCGDLSHRFGAVVVLEDDVVVSPFFYPYAIQALTFYSGIDAVAGIALYSYDVTESTRRRFIPLDDGFDCYFLQIAASSGQLWTATQWANFRKWYRSQASAGVQSHHGVPAPITTWPERSWKKYYIRYLIESRRYFVYPRTALSNNSGEPGLHASVVTYWDQVPLSLGERPYRFCPVHESLAVYDAYFELLPDRLKRLQPELSKYDLTVDLMGTKDLSQSRTQFALSSKTCSDPIATFGLRSLPDVANIMLREPGPFFSLGRSESFGELSAVKDWRMRSVLHKLPQDRLFHGCAAVYQAAIRLANRFSRASSPAAR